MDYTIYTFGSGEVLWKIFNGLAILMKSDSEYFTPMIRVSLLIGTFWAATRAIFRYNVGIFGRDWFLPTYLALTLLFVPKASVNIIDPVDPRHHFSRVDHVPAGLALVASLPSKLFYHITLMVEDVMMDVSASNVSRYTQTGPMFAAQLINASRHVRITDPILKRNLKDFTRQCYQLPFLDTNIDPGAYEAQNAPNILKFVSENAHPHLGLYWRGDGGSASFVNCAEGATLVRDALVPATGDGMDQLFSILSPFGHSGFDENGALEIHLKDAWDEVANLSSNAHDILGQQMMINAVLEAKDDKRDSLNMPRLHPELTSYSATRAWEGQTQGWLINGALAARHLPTIQGVMLGLLIMMFAFVVPISLLPGGMRVFGTWIKMIFWLNSWPLFFAMLNALGTMWLARYAAPDGLTLLTQTGLADHAFDAYTITQGMSWGVPMLAWALISGGGYALVQSISGLTANLGHSLGQNIADNTQSFDTQNLHNMQKLSYSVGQQQLSPSFLEGTRMSDGRLDLMYDTMGGVTGHQHTSNLRDSFMNSQSLSEGVISTQGYENNLQENLMTEAGKTYSHGFSDVAEYAEHVGKSGNYSNNISASEQKSINDSVEKVMSAAHQMSQTSNMTDSTSVDGSAGFSVEISVPKILEGLSPIKVSGDLGEKLSTSAVDQNVMQQMKTYNVDERDVRNFSDAMQYVRSGQLTFGDESAQRAADSWRTSVDKVEQLGDKFSASLSRSQKLSEIEQWTQNNGGSISSNITDEVLEKVAQDRFGGNKVAATRWATSHSSEWKEAGQSFIRERLQDTADWMERSGKTSFTESEMRDRLQGYSQSLKDSSSMNLTPTYSPKENAGFFGSFDEGSVLGSYEGSLDRTQIEKKRDEHGIGANFKAEMDAKGNDLEMKVTAYQSASLPETSIQDQGEEINTKYRERFNQSKFGRQVRNVVGGTVQPNEAQQKIINQRNLERQKR
jgi:conjugal transfer mating pair stabilization protein TraG